MTKLEPCFGLAVAVVVASTSAASAAPATQFDGAYSGQRTVVRGDQPDCIKPGPTTLSVQNGVFKLTYARNPFDAEVGADGSFERTKLFNAGQRTVSATLKGRIVDRTLEADLETYRCKYHYALTRK
jgi:hypothetical protein